MIPNIQFQQASTQTKTESNETYLGLWRTHKYQITVIASDSIRALVHSLQTGALHYAKVTQAFTQLSSSQRCCQVAPAKTLQKHFYPIVIVSNDIPVRVEFCVRGLGGMNGNGEEEKWDSAGNYLSPPNQVLEAPEISELLVPFNPLQQLKQKLEIWIQNTSTRDDAIKNVHTILENINAHRTEESRRTECLYMEKLLRQMAYADIPFVSTISKEGWGSAKTINLPPYPQELESFLSGNCTIWPGKQRSETHIVVPLFPEVDIDNNPIPLTLESLDEMDKSSGGPGYRYLWGQIPKNIPAEKEFHYAVMTNDIIPESRNRPYEEQIRLLPDGYEAPGVLDAARAILWKNRRSDKQYFNVNPYTYTRCKEVIQDCNLVVGGFSSSGLYIGSSYNDCEKFGIAGWRKF